MKLHELNKGDRFKAIISDKYEREVLTITGVFYKLDGMYALVALDGCPLGWILANLEIERLSK